MMGTGVQKGPAERWMAMTCVPSWESQGESLSFYLNTLAAFQIEPYFLGSLSSLCPIPYMTDLVI